MSFLSKSFLNFPGSSSRYSLNIPAEIAGISTIICFIMSFFFREFPFVLSRAPTYTPEGARGGALVIALARRVEGCGFDPARRRVLAIRRLSPPPRWMGSQTAVKPHPERVC